MDSYWNGNIKWFTPSEIGKSKYISDSERHITKEGLKNSSAKLLPKNTILLSSRATVGEASIALSVCTTNQGFQSLIINQNVDNEFIYYLISTIKNEFLRRSSGSTFLEISKNEIKKIKINIPSLEEQKQISKFFSSIDNKIKLLKEEYYKYSEFKRFLLNSIFSDSEDKLRFDFDDEWKQVKLKDIVERVTRKNTNLETDLALTISAEYGLIDQEEFFNKIVASKSLKNYYLIKNGEFAYNKSYSNGYPYGAIKRLDDYPMGALSTLYICFKPTAISSNYLKEYFETTFWYKEIYSIAVEGARNHGLLNINVNDFFNTKHLIPPSTEEQEKIADLFKCINSKIDAANNDLKLVKNFKKGLLQQMFV